MKKLLVAALILVFVAGTISAQSTRTQSQNSTDLSKPGFVPGDFFYPVEQFVEEIEVGISRAPVIGSPELEAKVRANNADERLAEARKLADENRSEAAEKLMQQYRSNMEIAAKNAQRTNNTLLSEQLGNVTAKHENVLKDVQTKVPAPAKDAIQKALDNNRKNFPNEKPRKTMENKRPITPKDKTPQNRVNKTNVTERFKDNISENTSNTNETIEESKEALNNSETIEETVNKTEETAGDITGDFSKKELNPETPRKQDFDSLP